MLHALSTIAEIDAELAAGTATLADARRILTPRSKRDASSGRRAAAWLKAHKATPKATPKAKPAPKPATPKVRMDQFTPEQKAIVWGLACKRTARVEGITKGAPGWLRATKAHAASIYTQVVADRIATNA